MEKFSQMMKELGPVKIFSIGLISIVLLGFLVAFLVRLSNPVLSPLFSSLEPEDSAQISAQLESMGVYYEINAGGSQIMVPADRVLGLRMMMAKEGLPNGSSIVGYEIFDKSETLGTSSFVNNVNLLRALEGELARTISSFDNISSSRVHLVMPRRDLFSRVKQEPTASVVLQMKGNGDLTKSEIGAISHLVATAVPGLNVKKITIVDTNGRPFKLGANDENDPGIFASSAESYRVQYENRLKATIEELLGRSVGFGKVEAQVSADIDFDRTVTNSEIYDPDGQVARSIQSTEEREVSSEGSQNISVTGNIPGSAPGQAGEPAGSNVERVDEITNFEISKTVKNHISETGNIKKISIAVLVDGVYALDEETDEYVYSPRSDEEIKQLETLVKNAVGFDQERGDTISMVNMKFSTEVAGVSPDGQFEWIKRDFGNIIKTLVIGIVVILVILLVIKPMVNRAFEFTKVDNDETDLQAALAGGLDLKSDAKGDIIDQLESGTDNIIDLEKFEEKMKSSSVGAINDIVNKHPEETMSIIRNWIEKNQ